MTDTEAKALRKGDRVFFLIPDRDHLHMHHSVPRAGIGTVIRRKRRSSEKWVEVHVPGFGDHLFKPAELTRREP
jgi:hypothetical protein